MVVMECFSPAKVNLYLHILGKREDGFHELETLMAPLSVGDEMTFEEIESGTELTIEGLELDAGPDNLIWKAADAVRRKSGTEKGIRIKVKKRIPLGGGLAGGSSNAATTLQACNEIWKAGLSGMDLHELAASMGSDINFFLEPGAAICRGRGEIVEPIQLDPVGRVLILNPGFPVPTPWAFQAYAKAASAEKKGDELPVKVTWEIQQSEKIGKQGEGAACRNDLEKVVAAKYYWISGAVDFLNQQEGVRGAMMSGSGASVVAFLSEDADEVTLRGRVKDWAGPRCWVEVAEFLL